VGILDVLRSAEEELADATLHGSARGRSRGGRLAAEEALFDAGCRISSSV